MDDLEPFESPKSLIQAANDAIAKLDDECTKFLDSCTYETVQRVEPSSGHILIAWRFHQRLPPYIRTIASSIVNDLRHALDQTVADAAVQLGRPNGKGVYFPFARTPADLDLEFKHRCRGVHVDLTAFIRRYNVHAGGDDFLYSFGALSGPNKHQRILRLSRSSNAGILTVDDQNPLLIEGLIELGGNKWNELRNEIQIAKIAANGCYVANFSPQLEIVLGAGDPPLSGKATITLQAASDKIEKIVLEIEAETGQIFNRAR